MTELGEMRAARAKIRTWRNDARAMVKDLWPSVKLEPWQDEGLEAASQPGKKRIVAHAAAGVGKTAWLSWLAWHRLLCFGTEDDHPKGAAVSMDFGNLMLNLAPEISRWGESCPLIKQAFHIQTERIKAKDHPKTWLLDFRAWPRKANPEEQGQTLQGLHCGFPFVLMDESATIPISVCQRAEQIEAAPDTNNSLIALTGNPTTQEGCLYRAAVTLAKRWVVIRITADPEDPNRCTRVDRAFAQQQIDDAPLGREDPSIQCYVLGHFPRGGMHQLLTWEQVEAAFSLSLKAHEFEGMPSVLGVDVARGGLDQSVIYRRQGRAVFPPMRRRGIDGIVGATLVAQEWLKHDCVGALIDDTGGFGSSWIDQLRVMKFQPIPVAFNGRATDPKRYFNKRTEMWWDMTQAVGRMEVALPPECRDILGAELTTPTYGFKGDRMILEDKKQIAARLGRSPDDGDALALTWGTTFRPKMLPHQEAVALGLHRQGSEDPVPYYDDLGNNIGGQGPREVPPWGPLRL